MRYPGALLLGAVLALAGCGGGGGSSTSLSPTLAPPTTDPTPDPVATDPGTPVAPPPALVDAEEQNFAPEVFDQPVAPSEQPTIEEKPVTPDATVVTNFFPGLTGGGDIPGAARGAVLNNLAILNVKADEWPDKAVFGLFGVRLVDGSQIAGNVQFSDPGVSLSAPMNFGDTGSDYPNRLVWAPGSGVSVESRVITFYTSGYRNDVYHERTWWAVISGEARVNGVDGYTFTVYAEDRRDPSDPSDTRAGADLFSISVFSPALPYGGVVMRDGKAIWGLNGVVYHNRYVLRSGDIEAHDTPPEPAG